MKVTTQLKEMLNRKDKIAVAAMVGCALDARIAELTGFEVAHISGANAAATVLGLPDAGLITASEMIDNARRIASSVKIPVICDADQGFGNAINTRRTVQEFVRAGIAGIHIEDQPTPKRCGYVKGKEVISIEEAVGKFRAAVDAKNEIDPDFVIMARCDARGTVGGTLDEVIKRIRAYKEAGVDVVFPEAMPSREELKQARASVAGPMWTTTGFLEPITPEEFQSLGMCLFLEFGMLGARTQAYWEYAKQVQALGAGAKAKADWQNRGWLHAVPHVFDLTGFPEVAEAEQKYLPEDQLKKYEGSIGAYEPRVDQRS